MRVTRLAVAAALVALLAAGCAGEPTGAQVEVQGVTSTAVDTAAITEPSRTQRTATTQRTASTRRASATTRTTTTTRRATTESKPTANPILTVEIVNISPAVGSLQVGIDPNADTGICPTKCRYIEFPKGTRIKVEPLELQAVFTIKVTGGRAECDEVGCTFTLVGDTTVTGTFG